MKRRQTGFARFACVMALVLVMGALSGCAWSIGGEKDGGTVVQKPTRGQELIDLKRARDQGALSDAEYEMQRRELLDQ